MKKSGLIISIDFELDWGYTNTENPLNESEISNVLDQLVALFDKYEVKSTWAIVGQLFEGNGSGDNSKHRSNWIHDKLLNNDLIEIGSHTYEHLFSREEELTLFQEDIKKMNELEKVNGLKFESIVFPRNQYASKQIEVLHQNGYKTFRSVLSSTFLKTNKFSNESRLKRYLIRLVELFPLKRDVEIAKDTGLISISDSRFFRFFGNGNLGKLVSKLYYPILQKEFKSTIQRGGLFHIWFHPHNLMKNDRALRDLENFLKFYQKQQRINPKIDSFKFSDFS